MSRYDMIIDFETLGSRSLDCAAIDLSVYIFDWDRFLENPYSYQEVVDGVKKYKFSVDDQVRNYGFKIEKDTLSFWKRQEKDVRDMIKPSDEDLTVSEFTETFIKYLQESPKIEYWWTRNNTFDPIILWRIMWTQQSKYHINEYLKYWRVRDIKTWIDAKFDFNTLSGFIPISDTEYWEKTFKQHDSRYDVAADVLRLQTIYRAENDLEQTKR